MPGLVTRHIFATDKEKAKVQVSNLITGVVIVETEFDNNINPKENHINAVLLACEIMRKNGNIGWEGVLQYSPMRNGYVFVFERSDPIMVSEKEWENS